MMLRTRLSFFALTLLACSSVAEEWKPARNKNGIEIHTRKIEGISFKQYRGKTTVNASLASIVAAFKDLEAAKKFSDRCDEIKLIETISTQENYTYFYTKAPWPIKDRDAVVHNLITQNPESLTVTILQKARPEKCPEHQDAIRIHRIDGVWILTPIENGQVEILYETLTDPGGALPVWLVNAVSVSIPYNTLKGIRETAESPKHQDARFQFIAEPEK